MKYTHYILAAGVALVACDRSDEPAEELAEAREEAREEIREEDELGNVVKTNEPSTNQATAKPGMHFEAVKRIVDARCAREQKCANVGVDAKYADEASCRQQVSEEWTDDLNQRECAGGIVQKELNECLAEIKNEDCASPFDSLERIVACRESDICKAIDSN